MEVPPRVGMVGGGQLARMTHQAGIALGLSLRVLAERADDSAALVAADVELGAPTDEAALAHFAAGCDVVTFDHELVPPELLEGLARHHLVRPSPGAKLLAQDKLYQRETLQAWGFPVPAFSEVQSEAELQRFGAEHGWPLVLKAARGGYDGRGVWVAGTAADALDAMRRGPGPWLVEELLPLERELAVMVARRPAGECAVYPVVETVQVDGMCREVLAPAPVTPGLAAEAVRIGAQLAGRMGLEGIMAIELFVARGRLLVNEVACRPHNSGHYTIEGTGCSQFENHLRAVLDWPLGSAALAAPAVVTVNVVGGPEGRDPRRALPEALAIPGVHVHLYGKGPRPGRKLGHVTALGADMAEVRARALQAAGILGALHVPGGAA